MTRFRSKIVKKDGRFVTTNVRTTPLTSLQNKKPSLPELREAWAHVFAELTAAKANLKRDPESADFKQKVLIHQGNLAVINKNIVEVSGAKPKPGKPKSKVKPEVPDAATVLPKGEIGRVHFKDGSVDVIFHKNGNITQKTFSKRAFTRRKRKEGKN